MAFSLKHKFTSPKSDGGDASLVKPSNWNDEHDLTLAASRLLGRSAGTAGAVQEIPLGPGLQFNAGSLEANFPDFATGIHAAASKVTLVDADEFPLADSAASFALKKTTAFDIASYVSILMGFERISGCETVYVTTTTIQMKAGWVFFKGKRTTFAAALTKNLAALFSAGNAGGFLDTGAMAASKTYFIHAVRNTSTGAGDWVASLQSDPALVNTANLTGFEVEGRVNVVLTTSGNVIRQYTQDGNEYRLTTQVTEITGSSWAVADFQFISAPAGISTELIYTLHNFQNATSSGQVAVWTDATSGPVLGVMVVANTSSAMSVDASQRSRTRSTGVVRSQAVSTGGTGVYSVFMTGFNDYTAPRRNGASA